MIRGITSPTFPLEGEACRAVPRTRTGHHRLKHGPIRVPAAAPASPVKLTTAAQLAAQAAADPNDRARLERARRAADKLALADLREKARAIDRRTPAMTLHQIAGHLAHQCGICTGDYLDLLRVQCRHSEKVAERAVFCKAARLAGHNDSSIGRFIRRHRSDVSHLCSAHPEALAKGGPTP